MKKIFTLTIGILLFASASYAGLTMTYPVDVVINSDGSKYVYGNIQNTADSSTTNDYLYVSTNGSNVYVAARDSANESAFASTSNATIVATAHCISDRSYINAQINSSGQITYLYIGQMSHHQ